MKQKYFKEKQRFDSVEIIVILVFSMTLLIYSLFNSLQTHHWAFTYVEWSTIGLLLILGGYLWYLTHLRLHISLSEEGIHYKMKPLHQKKRKIPWQKVASCEVVRTSGVAQWHGGNISFNYEKRFTLNGRNGLHVVTVDGKEYFLGTKKIDELKNAIEEVLED